MQAVYERFRARAAWADVDAIQRDLDRAGDDLDVDLAAAEIPRGYLYGRLEPGGELRLSLRGVAACDRSEDDATHFLAALRLALERHLGPEDKPTITSEDFSDPTMDDLGRRRLLMLLDSEPYIVAGGHSNDRGWSRFVSPRVRRFREVKTLDQYFSARAAIDADLRREATAVSAPLPGSPSLHRLSGAEIDLALDVSDAHPVPAAPVDPQLLSARATADRYADLVRRASSVLEQLESSAPLAPILPAAYALLADAGDDEGAQRVLLESQGFPYALKQRKDSSDGEVRAIGLYMKARRTDIGTSEGGFAAHPMVEMEEILRLADANLAAETINIARELRVLIIRIRMDLVVAVTRLRQRLDEDQGAIELFGSDALSVLAAGGEILAPLRRAVRILRAGNGPGAALEARSALIAIGEQLLKDGAKERVSPFDGRAYVVQGERTRMRAVLGELWERTADASRRTLLSEACDLAERAYRLGSRAKRPGAVTHAECVEGVRLTYRVARAIALCAGFPLAELVPAKAAASAPEEDE